MWDFVTDFGDSAVTLPLAAWVLVFLVATGKRRAALAWAAAVVVTGAVMGGLKLLLGACGAGATDAAIVSPSGHTAMSTVVYGALAVLIAAPLGPRGRRIVGIAAAAVVFAIAWSRVALHHHTRTEIVVGFLVGAAGLAVFRAMPGRDDIRAMPLRWLLLGAAVLVAGMHGTRWMVEPVVRRLALNLSFLC